MSILHVLCVDIRAHRIPKPFCDLTAAGYFLGLTFNQVQGFWENGTLPRALARDGSLWMPANRRLVRAAPLYEMLDERGRELFTEWQYDELRLPGAATNSGNRDVPLRQLELQDVPDHGTTERYRRACRCEPCVEANRAWHRDHRKRTKEAHGAV